MLNIHATNIYKKNFVLAKKRNKDINKLHTLLEILINITEENIQIAVPKQYKAHKLSGNWSGYWEAHIEPDWLLIYDFDFKNNTLILHRTGSHSDLFKK